MGHIKSNVYKKVSENLQLATQYDINMYSMHSDVTVGFEYRILDLLHTLKVSCSLANGIGLCSTIKFDWGLLSMGFNLGKTTFTDWGLSLEIF